MLNSAWLDIATGVVLVWFLFALAVSAANEALVKVLALRSKQLWSALRQMLDGTESPQGILRNLVGLPSRARPSSPYPAANAGIAAQLYATQTMQSLEVRTRPTQKTRIENIPASVFSQSLLELALTAGSTAAGAVKAAGPTVLSAVDQAGATSAQVQSYVNNLPPGPLRAQLQTVLATAGHDVTQFSGAIEHWFNGQMTRLSRIYRAQVHIILVFLGLLVAVLGFGFGLQSNSLQLVSELQHDQNLRTMVVGAATSAARGDLVQAGGCKQEQIAVTPAECQLQGLRNLNKINFALRAPLPSGASFGERLGFLMPWRHFYDLLGVVITGVAISFGSSFWFALLKRLVGLRSGGGTTAAN